MNVNTASAGSRQFSGLALAGTGLVAVPAAAAPPHGPVHVVSRRRSGRRARRSLHFSRPAELGLEHLPHLLHSQLGSGQCLPDHLGWREPTAGQPRSRRTVLAPGYPGLL